VPTQECIAWNYDPYSFECDLLSSLGDVIANEHKLTSLVSFAGKLRFGLEGKILSE